MEVGRDRAREIFDRILRFYGQTITATQKEDLGRMLLDVMALDVQIRAFITENLPLLTRSKETVKMVENSLGIYEDTFLWVKEAHEAITEAEEKARGEEEPIPRMLESITKRLTVAYRAYLKTVVFCLLNFLTVIVIIASEKEMEKKELERARKKLAEFIQRKIDLGKTPGVI